jgi:hypothetical protein
MAVRSLGQWADSALSPVTFAPHTRTGCSTPKWAWIAPMSHATLREFRPFCEVKPWEVQFAHGKGVKETPNRSPDQSPIAFKTTRFAR